MVANAFGLAKAYHRIYGYEIDEDRRKIIVRTKIYADKATRQADEMPLKKREFRIERVAIYDHFNEEAGKWVAKNVDLEKEAQKEINALNEKRKELKLEAMPVEQEKREKEMVKNRFISEKQKELTSEYLNEFYKTLIGNAKEKRQHIKKTIYDCLKMLPEFTGAVDA